MTLIKHSAVSNIILRAILQKELLFHFTLVWGISNESDKAPNLHLAALFFDALNIIFGL